MSNIQKIFKNTPEKILEKISLLREKKGEEERVHGLIGEAFVAGHEFVINLFWEEALLYHHKIMSEEVKLQGKRSGKVIKSNLKKWEEVVGEAEFYIEKYEITRWKSRLYRFKGRLFDYKKEYKKAIEEYKKSLKFVKKDADHVENKEPRWLEIEAFLASSTMMSGEVEKGLEMSKKIYSKFDESREGKFLKKNDLPTWIVWKSGIAIRLGQALIEKKEDFDKRDVLRWLNEAEKLVKKPVTSKKWGGEVNFNFRKDEIETLKKMLA